MSVTSYEKWLLLSRKWTPKIADGMYNTNQIEYMKDIFFDSRNRALRLNLEFNMNLAIPAPTEEKWLELCDIFYRKDLAYYLGKSEIQQSLQNDIKATSVTPKRWWFVTVGFDDKTITDSRIKTCHESVIKMDGFIFNKWSIEKFRKNDDGRIIIHHHIHYLVYSDYPKSKVVQYFFQKCKKYIASKNFIDVKNDGEFERYEKYLDGHKTETKMECVEMDKQWRLKSGLNNSL